MQFHCYCLSAAHTTKLTRYAEFDITAKHLVPMMTKQVCKFTNVIGIHFKGTKTKYSYGSRVSCSVWASLQCGLYHILQCSVHRVLPETWRVLVSNTRFRYFLLGFAYCSQRFF